MLFKACKSYLNINKVGRCGAEQLECIIYGRLIAIVILFGYYAVLYAWYYFKENREVRMLCFFSLIATKATLLNDIVFGKQGKLIDNLKRVAEQSFHEKRKRKTSMEVFLQFYFDSFSCESSREKLA